MIISDFDYELPSDLIAQYPLERRDRSRLLVANRSDGRITESIISNMGDYLRTGDLLVVNDTYVQPARLWARKNGNGALIEILLLKRYGERTWEAMAQRVSRLRPGVQLVISSDFHAEVVAIRPDGTITIEFSFEGEWDHLLSVYGHVPLPPYIRRDSPQLEQIDRNRYQTVYAVPESGHPSAAAPTAGLHFTDELLNRLQLSGIQIAKIQLQVGMDTFLPIRVDNLDEHTMHEEWYRLSNETAEMIGRTRANGGRIVAVGTTVVRTLESAIDPDGQILAGERTTNLFIKPGYQFKIVDALLTNFHLPRSTLIVLVAAFCGHTFQRQIYQEAINRRFRFYSYGDTMLVL